ncbi:MAG: hypothetical protein R3E01_35560, partial [Pirellulaceae bacterium]
YRWKMLGENGEEFIMTILGAVPVVQSDDTIGHLVTGYDLQFSLPSVPTQGTPYPVVPVFDANIDFPRTGMGIFMVVEERPDLGFSFAGSTNPGYTTSIDNWGNDQAFSSRSYRIEVNDGPFYSGKIVSVSRIPVPEPTAFTYAALGGLLCLRRPRNRDKERQPCVHY